MNNHSWPHTIRIIVFSCLLGAAAGVIGTALTTNYLSEYALSLGSARQSNEFSQTRPLTLPQSYQDAFEKLEEQSLPAVGSLFAAQDITQAWISVFDPSLTVVGLTSDGWGLSTGGVVGDFVRFGAQTCEVDLVRTEPLFGLRFLHCAAANIPVMDMTSGYEVQSGDQLFVVAQDHDVVFTQARSIVWGDALRESDVPSRRIVLTADAPLVAGAAVFNVYGELVGIVEQGDGRTQVIPFEHVSGAFRQVLESTQSITYPSLGVYGIDLSRAVGVAKELSNSRHAGFLLYGPGAVAVGSVAEKAGFNVGDVLLSVEGVAINGTYALDDLLAFYFAGDEIQIEFERDGSRQEVTVVLGELEI